MVVNKTQIQNLMRPHKPRLDGRRKGAKIRGEKTSKFNTKTDS